MLLQVAFAYSQNAEIEVVDLKPTVNENKFPEVHCENNPKIAEKINTFLQVMELEHVPNVFKIHPFEKVMLDTNNCCSYVDFAYWTLNKTPRSILSISLAGEAGGAYITGFSTIHNFDVRTGDKLVIKNILSERGAKEITEWLHIQIKSQLDSILKILNIPITENYAIEKGWLGEDLESDEKERVLDALKEETQKQIDLYQDCFYQTNAPSLDYAEIIFQESGIKFTIDECANHASRALDGLIGYSFKLSYNELEKHLSEYGKSLLNNDNKCLVAENPEGKMFKGKINSKYPITAIVTRWDDYSDCSILYWYDKVKVPIQWNGKYNNNHLSLKEYDEEHHSGCIAEIEADWKNNKIIGMWKNIKTGQKLTIELKGY
ncbi:hypothetical protein AGMMS4956_21340 [Bacteroidia bacterium]|nr:hypothetical protein AGMMS4956_21340 [Bacteroidia bacterium]